MFSVRLKYYKKKCKMVTPLLAYVMLSSSSQVNWERPFSLANSVITPTMSMSLCLWMWGTQSLVTHGTSKRSFHSLYKATFIIVVGLTPEAGVRDEFLDIHSVFPINRDNGKFKKLCFYLLKTVQNNYWIQR